jgi:hypothetical protein
VKNQELLALRREHERTGAAGPCRQQGSRPYTSQAERDRAEGRSGAREAKTMKEEDGQTLSDRFPIIPHDQSGECCGWNRRVHRHQKQSRNTKVWNDDGLPFLALDLAAEVKQRMSA